MAEICVVKVETGSVVALDRFGAKVLPPIYPNSGGAAIFADYNPALNKIVVLTEKGAVIIMSGTSQSAAWYGNGHITMVRWAGNDIAVTNQNGSSELRSQNGGWIKPL